MGWEGASDHLGMAFSLQIGRLRPEKLRDLLSLSPQ